MRRARHLCLPAPLSSIPLTELHHSALLFSPTCWESGKRITAVVAHLQQYCGVGTAFAFFHHPPDCLGMQPGEWVQQVGAHSITTSSGTTSFLSPVLEIHRVSGARWEPQAPLILPIWPLFKASIWVRRRRKWWQQQGMGPRMGQGGGWMGCRVWEYWHGTTLTHPTIDMQPFPFYLGMIPLLDYEMGCMPLCGSKKIGRNSSFTLCHNQGHRTCAEVPLTPDTCAVCHPCSGL